MSAFSTPSAINRMPRLCARLAVLSTIAALRGSVSQCATKARSSLRSSTGSECR